MLPWGTKVPVLSVHFLSHNIYFFYFGKIGILHCSPQILCLGSPFPWSTWVKELAFKYVWQSTAHGLLHFLFLFFLGWAGGLITVSNKPQESVNRLHTSLIRFDCFALALPLLKKKCKEPVTYIHCVWCCVTKGQCCKCCMLSTFPPPICHAFPIQPPAPALGKYPGDTAGSCDVSLFTFLRDPPSDCASLHPHQQCVEGPWCPHPHQPGFLLYLFS